MASSFNGSVLDLASDFAVEISLYVLRLGEVRVVASVALDAYPPALLSHSEDEGPALFWVQVGIREDQEALVLLQFDIIL